MCVVSNEDSLKIYKQAIEKDNIWTSNFNISLLIIDRKSKQTISNDTENLKNTNNQLALTEIYTTIHKTAKSNFLLKYTGTLIKISQILGNKTNLNRFKRTEIIQSRNQ